MRKDEKEVRQEKEFWKKSGFFGAILKQRRRHLAQCTKLYNGALCASPREVAGAMLGASADPAGPSAVVPILGNCRCGQLHRHVRGAAPRRRDDRDLVTGSVWEELRHHRVTRFVIGRVSPFLFRHNIERRSRP